MWSRPVRPTAGCAAEAAATTAARSAATSTPPVARSPGGSQMSQQRPAGAGSWGSRKCFSRTERRQLEPVAYAVIAASASQRWRGEVPGRGLDLARAAVADRAQEQRAARLVDAPGLQLDGADPLGDGDERPRALAEAVERQREAAVAVGATGDQREQRVDVAAARPRTGG